MRTQVVIIGGGPAGVLLSHLLHRSGIESVVLERQTRAYVLGRIRAGVLEQGTADMLREAGLGARMDREGFVHTGTNLAMANRGFRVDFEALLGKSVTIYGQTELQKDLYDARDAAGGTIIDEAEGVTPHGFDGEAPYVTYVKDGVEHRIDCDWIAGCDGYHGVSRRSLPEGVVKTFERSYPFAWLGVLALSPPVAEELIYANHPRGFALCSMRRSDLSRHYIQVPQSERAEAWSDDAFWDELRRRIPTDAAEALRPGPVIEKSVTPLRSFVAEPLRFGRLFLVGDAAHIVPPTGAKGLNLAVSDVRYLHEGLAAWYGDGESGGVDTYSDRALNRVWKAIRFSFDFTRMMHRFPNDTDFDQKVREAQIDLTATSRHSQAAMAENYVGLPF